MPDRLALAASHATGIGPDPGSRDLPYDGDGSVALSLIKSMLTDPLGIGQGSQQRLTPATFNASAKPLRDMIGEIVKPTRGSGLPQRLRVTSYDTAGDKVRMHGIGQDVRPVESTIGEFTKLHDSGALLREGPPTEGLSVPALIKRLLQIIDK